MSFTFAFAHPTTILIAGPTQCGKTHFLAQVLLEQRFAPSPQRIVWVYGEWQPTYEHLRRAMPQIEFVENFTSQLYDSFRPDTRNVLILDDQMENKDAHKRGSNSVTKFFTQGSHHRNLTVIYIVQNLFNKDNSMRTVSLNTHYMVLFKNPRDATQIRTLASQMYPDRTQFLIQAFRDATSKPHGYLLINLRPDACDELRILTDVLEDEPTVYVATSKV
jgi:hypothetical protein